MKRNLLLALSAIVVLSTAFCLSAKKDPLEDDRFVTYAANPSAVKLYWKNDKGELFRSLQNLKDWCGANGNRLVFAMNGGMYKEDNSPLGLYIENGKTLSPLNKATATGNFYLQPNGVFYITADGKGIICKTGDFINNGKIKYATQSGPMLVIDGKLHSAFQQGSQNVHIRNGVGILPDGKVVFAMSKKTINFYDFAKYFQDLGCRNALYLDGFVSRTYLPEKEWVELGGNFGVMIGVTEPDLVGR
jgi:uncharacterized protein YigE (DUF2233 family)